MQDFSGHLIARMLVCLKMLDWGSHWEAVDAGTVWGRRLRMQKMLCSLQSIIHWETSSVCWLVPCIHPKVFLRHSCSPILKKKKRFSQRNLNFREMLERYAEKSRRNPLKLDLSEPEIVLFHFDGTCFKPWPPSTNLLIIISSLP